MADRETLRASTGRWKNWVTATIFGAFCWMASAHMPAPAYAAETDTASAVVLIYHRFGERGLPLTNIRLTQFEAHIAELTSGPYNIVSLPEIIDALEKGRALPDRTVAITVDDGFLSAYQEAWPRLKSAAIPLTMFVSTESIDLGQKGYLTWRQIREMVDAGVYIGHHGAEHAHMPARDTARNRADIARASRRFEVELGQSPDIFAYPYGEFGNRDKELVKSMGFRAAFGQHSGAIDLSGAGETDMFALPRFPMNENYGDIDRLKLAVNALPFPVRDVLPADTLLTAETNPPYFGFTAGEDIIGLGALGCFASGQNAPLKINRLGERRVEVRMESAFAPGRGRINCTLRHRSGRWHWLGRQFVIPDPTADDSGAGTPESGGS